MGLIASTIVHLTHSRSKQTQKNAHLHTDESYLGLFPKIARNYVCNPCAMCTTFAHVRSAADCTRIADCRELQIGSSRQSIVKALTNSANGPIIYTYYVEVSYRDQPYSMQYCIPSLTCEIRVQSAADLTCAKVVHIAHGLHT